MNGIIKNLDYDYFGMKKAIKELCERYPFLHTEVIGRSSGGRDITMLRIGRTDEYALFSAGFHGSENITSNLLLAFTEELCSAIENDGEIAGLNVRKSMYGRGLVIIPAVNPDGIEICLHGASACGYMASKIIKLCKGDFEHWNANLRGVDINHNFNAGWNELHEKEKAEGIYGPAMTRFGGFRPESEPETLALTELCRTVKIRHVLAFHSQGEVIYWNYEDIIPPRAKKMAEIMATSSGYALDVPVGIASGGGFKDWFISEFNRPGFTVEIGKGENPLPMSDLDDIYAQLKEMLMLSAIM